MAIGPVPDEILSDEAQVKFGLGHMTKIFKDKGINAQVDGSQAVVTLSHGNEPAESMSAGSGMKLDNRAYRVVTEGQQFKLELSLDLGSTFLPEASFTSPEFEDLVGSAWVDGRIEKIR